MARASRRERRSARPLGWSNSDTALRVERQADAVAALRAAPAAPTLARSVEPTAVVTVTIWLWPRYSLPSTSARRLEALVEAHVLGAHAAQQRARRRRPRRSGGTRDPRRADRDLGARRPRRRRRTG